MKKILSIAAVAALLSTGAIANNTINVNGTVLAGAQVSLGSAPTGTLVGGTFIFEDAILNFNTALTLGQANSNNQDVFVKTNSNTGVSLTLTSTPDLSDGNGNTIPTTYSLGATQFIAGIAQGLTNGPNNGTTALANQFKTIATTSPLQTSGTYSSNLNVIIAVL